MTDGGWPWEYLYTMATVYLHRSDSEFWAMTPRLLVSMIAGWKKIERGQMSMHAYIAAGGNPEELDANPAEQRAKELEMGAMMW